VKKVRNIEHAGGALALIMHDHIDKLNKEMMNDDGSGGGIQIPSILIGKRSGDVLIKYLEDSTTAKEVALFSLFEMVRLIVINAQ
jgi:hypothetical protein